MLSMPTQRSVSGGGGAFSTTPAAEVHHSSSGGAGVGGVAAGGVASSPPPEGGIRSPLLPPPTTSTKDAHVTTSTTATAPSSHSGASPLAEMVGHKDLATLRNRYGMQSGVAAALDTDLRRGVAIASVPLRQQAHGRNVLPQAPLNTLWDYVKEALEDRTLQILIGAAVVSLILGMTTPDPRTGDVDRSTGWIEGAAILLSVAIVTLISSLNNFQKQNQFSELVEASDRLRPVVVVRDGHISEVESADVVVGDIVMVYGGMALAFDAILTEGDGFCCDESSLTGEAERVSKTLDTDPFLLSGTSVTDGCEGLALVVAVGSRSFSGAIASAVQESQKKNTPLQDKLEHMADIIGKFGLAAAIITFASLLLKELYLVFVAGGTFYFMRLFENLTTAIAIVVVAVPEGLPLSVTISLAYSMKRMLQDKNLVRHLAACETMGGATTICSDKTGTLTQSDMYLRCLYSEGQTTDHLQSTTGPWRPAMSLPTARAFLDCIAHNTVDVIGTNKTNQAISVALERMRDAFAYDAIAAVRATDKTARVRFPFSSSKKQCSAVVRGAAGGGHGSNSSGSHGGHGGHAVRHYVIGASEMVLQSCTRVYGPNGVVEPLTGALRQQYEDANSAFMADGLRTLCVAVGERHGGWSDLPRAPPQEPLTLIAIAGIEEPLRPEVPEAIASCRRAGIRVIMLTGDGLPTALNIARRCGMMSSHSSSIDGPTFRGMADDEIHRAVLPTLTVLARATPLDKRRLVELIKANPREVVAVTGDGTNDAPALKAADVGFAMNSGSDVAKRASDIVLLDDNFVGIVRAAMWGRNVSGNIRKFIQFQLTVNIAACVIAFVGAIMNNQNLSPLKPVQLLWLNLIMDTLAALALATELPSSSLLTCDPEPKDANIVTPCMWQNITSQCIFQLATQVWLLGSAQSLFGITPFSDRHLTIVFNGFVWMQIFNFFNARLLSGGHQGQGLFTDLGTKSATLLRIVLLICVAQVLIVHKGGRFFSTVPLSSREWLQCIGIASGSLVVGIITRWYQRSHHHHHRGTSSSSSSISSSSGGSTLLRVLPQGLHPLARRLGLAPHRPVGSVV